MMGSVLLASCQAHSDCNKLQEIWISGSKIAGEQEARCWRISEGGARLCGHCKVDDNGKHSRGRLPRKQIVPAKTYSLELHNLCVVLVFGSSEMQNLLTLFSSLLLSL